MTNRRWRLAVMPKTWPVRWGFSSTRFLPGSRSTTRWICVKPMKPGRCGMETLRCFNSFLRLVLLSAICTVAFAQEPATRPIKELPSFEVATIKPVEAHSSVVWGLYTYPGGRVFAGFYTLKDLLREVYHIQAFQVVGGPKWIEDEHYDINAIPPDDSPARSLKPALPNTPPSSEQLQMLERLVRERFKLKYHFETKTGSVYFLSRNGKALRLEQPKDKDAIPYLDVRVYNNGVGNGEIIGMNATMAFVAQRLSGIMEKTVLDRTDLNGSFDMHVAPPDQANADITN